MFSLFNPRAARCLFCLTLTLLASQIAQAQEATGGLHAPGITPALRQQDTRLLKPVSLVSLRIPVGELMERLSQQTGVALDADEDSGAADAEVAVSLRAVPLADVLDALWSLVGYQKATWEWQRSGTAPAYHYRLFRPAEARLFAASIPDQIQHDFEAEADAHIADAEMSPEQMQEAARTDPAVAGMLDSPRLDQSLPRQVEGLRAFAETLSPEQRQAVLKGQSITIPASALPDAGRQFLHDVFAEANAMALSYFAEAIRGGAVLKPGGEPDKLYFHAEASGNELTPTMYIQLGNIGGYGYVGGLPFQDKWAKNLAALWMLPGDAAADPAETQRCRPAGPLPVNRIHSDGADVLARDLIGLTPGAGVSLIARLPPGHQRDLAPPAGQTVADYLQHCQEYPSLARKWRHGVLLLTYPAWFREEGDKTKAPWAVIKHLRDAEVASPSGVLSLGDLTWAAAKTNTAQMHDLSRWFPDIDSLARWHDFLALLYGDPTLTRQLEAPQGTLWPNSVWPTVPADLQLQPQVDDGTIQAARISVTTNANAPILLRLFKRNGVDTRLPYQELSFEALSKDGKRIAGEVQDWAGHQYTSSVLSHSPTSAKPTP